MWVVGAHHGKDVPKLNLIPHLRHHDHSRCHGRGTSSGSGADSDSGSGSAGVNCLLYLARRTLQEAVRAIGYLQDTSAIGLLSDVLTNHIEPKTGNLFLAEAAIDALGRIATPEAETLLIDTFARLQDYISVR